MKIIESGEREGGELCLVSELTTIHGLAAEGAADPFPFFFESRGMISSEAAFFERRLPFPIYERMRKMSKKREGPENLYHDLLLFLFLLTDLITAQSLLLLLLSTLRCGFLRDHLLSIDGIALSRRAT